MPHDTPQDISPINSAGRLGAKVTSPMKGTRQTSPPRIVFFVAQSVDEEGSEETAHNGAHIGSLRLRSICLASLNSVKTCLTTACLPWCGDLITFGDLLTKLPRKNRDYQRMNSGRASIRREGKTYTSLESR